MMRHTAMRKGMMREVIEAGAVRRGCLSLGLVRAHVARAAAATGILTLGLLARGAAASAPAVDAPPGTTSVAGDAAVKAPADAPVKPSPHEPATIRLPRTGVLESLHEGDDAFHGKGQPLPSPRFSDNGNGTVTDLLTGLVWLQDLADVATPLTWEEALRTCNALATGKAGLSDGSQAGEWRLPNRNELLSLIDYASTDPVLTPGHPFRNVSADVHWTSTTRLDSPKLKYAEAVTNAARTVDLRRGLSGHLEKAGGARVWPVRNRRQDDPGVAAEPAAPVPRTGQTRSYAAGDDGDHQAGRPWPVPRFIDNGDGTVTDHLTGLIWLRSNTLAGGGKYEKALAKCNALESGKCGLSDGSKAGDWRLPNVRELLSLVDHSRRDPPLAAGHPFVKVDPQSHWTSTPLAGKPGAGHRVGVRDGGSGVSSYIGSDGVWPVRGGH